MFPELVTVDPGAPNLRRAHTQASDPRRTLTTIVLRRWPHLRGRAIVNFISAKRCHARATPARPPPETATRSRPAPLDHVRASRPRRDRLSRRTLAAPWASRASLSDVGGSAPRCRGPGFARACPADLRDDAPVDRELGSRLIAAGLQVSDCSPDFTSAARSEAAPSLWSLRPGIGRRFPCVALVASQPIHFHFPRLLSFWHRRHMRNRTPALSVVTHLWPTAKSRDSGYARPSSWMLLLVFLVAVAPLSKPPPSYRRRGPSPVRRLRLLARDGASRSGSRP